MDFKKNPDTDFADIEDLGREGAREEVEALREAIDYHDYLYYVKNQPKISDTVYDELFRRLQELEEAFPELQSDTSPTRRIGAPPVDRLEKIRHTETMQSLNSALDEKEIRNFHDFVLRNTGEDGVTYVVEPKFDGLSVEVVYENGRFQYGATRGDGVEGEDVSENMKTVRRMPLRLQPDDGTPLFLAVRGEVFMSKKGFQETNRERIERGEEPFANPRNAAAGTMRQLDSKKVADKPLDIFFYDILRIEGAGFSSHWEALKQFSRWGLPTDPHSRRYTELEKIKAYRDRLSEERDDLDYDIDGIVIKLDDYELRRSLGTRERSPRWAVAWKFPPKKEITVLEEIVVQVGRTGMLTPVALLQPVDVGGVTVSRATLHNEEEVLRKDVRPGDRVRVERAGDVIPEVVERIKERGRKRGEKFSMPDTCPSCSAQVVREGAYSFCPAGLSCPAQLIGHIIHFASRDALNIEGLGEKTAKDMVRKEMVENMADLYRLTVEDLLELEGFADKSARQLHEAIQAKKEPRLDRFLYALGIRHVGRRVARLLAGEFGTLDELRGADRERLEEVPEIGPEIAQSVEKFFSEDENRAVLDSFAGLGVEPQAMEREKATPLEGKTFVFTGKLEGFTRTEAKERVEALGARATSSVSGETDYLVAGENPGSKLDDARREGVEILDEKGFEELLKEAR